MNAAARLTAIHDSYRSLPGWVQIWVGLVLTPVNAAGFFLLGTFSGQATALAAVVVVLTNLPIMWHYAGMNKAMSIPHLFAWIPLHVALVGRLVGAYGEGPLELSEWLLAVAVLVVNTISLLFDLVDSWGWLQGDRATPGHDS
ncbi:MAG: hypothetical protein JKY64_09100 [Alcanivorax sp.]|nr:hypothetical protein [Alcanivorax sp.]